MKNSSKKVSDSSVSLMKNRNKDGLVELRPRRSISSGRFIRRVAYRRVEVNGFTKYLINKLYKERNVKDLPIIAELDNYFLIQYPDYPAFFLSMEDESLFTIVLP